jgi:FkbM family methyltransferase
MIRVHTFLKRKQFETKLPKEVLQIILNLKREDICIDVGANVGLVSEIFLSKGAEVYAFEPHPAAYAKLVEVKEKYNNFTPFNSAAGVSDGKVNLYLHTSHHSDPVMFSTGSSLMESKPNVVREFIVSEVVNFAKFLSSFSRIRILKIDIEGYEVELIPHLINLKAFNNVEHIFVETHEKKWPELAKKTTEMKRLVSESSYNEQIRWDWP